MNFFFGQFGEGRPTFAKVDSVAVAYGTEPSPLPSFDFGTAWAGTGGGATLGHFEAAGCSLVYLGTILGGTPGWGIGIGSPLDDPNRTAEFLLSRYQSEGRNFLDGIPGIYVLILIDRARNTAFLATDPAGGHSLFVRETGDGLQFATNLSLMPTVFGGIGLDRGLEDFILGYQFLPHDRTVYSGVEKLPGGTLLEWCDGRQSCHAITGWHGDAPDLSSATINEAIDALHEGFMQALADVAPTDERVAVALGGFDSALVASGLRIMGKEVHTFTFHFADASFNQPKTNRLSDEIGTIHHPVEIGPEVIAAGLENYARRFNLTAVQPHYAIESVEVCRKIREAGMAHAITGDGCDGLFLGYPTIYRRTRVVNALTKIPKPFRTRLTSLLGSRTLERRLGHPLRVARNLGNMLTREPLVRDHFAARALDSSSLDWARGEDLAQDQGVEELLQELARPVAGLSRVRRAYHSKALAGSNRNKMEGCIDVAGVAMTSPFTHPRFAKLASTMDDAMSRPGEGESGLGKHALMTMAIEKKLLPQDIVRQAKRSPAEAPVDGWYFNELRPTMERILRQLPFDIARDFEDGLFSRKLSEDMYRKHIALDTIATHALAALATYAAFNGVLTEVDAS